jgi:Zn-dependent protease with chaperone function
MDFFDRQDKARQKTKVLVVCFALAVACITLAVYLVFAAAFLRRHFQPDSLHWLWDAKLFAGVAGATLAVIAAGTLFKLYELRQGGRAVAIALGGAPLHPHAADPDERKVLNVIEEMAIASGTPVPEVYLLRQEPGINAFAAGHTPTDAAIGVSRGCLKLLSRDELQGVVAHEFSHILNGDMRLNLRLIGLINGILCIAVIGRLLWEWAPQRSGGRSRRLDSGAHWLPLIGLAMLAIGYVGVLFGRLIKSAVARQREFLADAAAVQFTRHPDGLAGALKKIGGLSIGSRIHSPLAEEASHLFFSNGLSESWFALFSTHPPLVERIRAIDPSFNGRFVPVTLPAAEPEVGAPSLAALLEGRPMDSGPPVPLAPLTGAGTPAVRADTVARQAAGPQPQHIQHAASLLAALPENLAAAAHEPLGATALVYSLLLSSEETTRLNQMAQLETHASAAMVFETKRLVPTALQAPPATRLALVDLALPALRRMSPEQFRQFTDLIQALIEADRQIDLFEYALQRLVIRHLRPSFQTIRQPTAHYYTLQPLLGEVTVLLSALAHVGHGENAPRQAAFRAGAESLGAECAGATLLDFAACNLSDVDRALDKLRLASPPLKRRVIQACAQAIAADGFIQEKEAELLRAIADALDCPLPPFVPLTGGEAN